MRYKNVLLWKGLLYSTTWWGVAYAWQAHNTMVGGLALGLYIASFNVIRKPSQRFLGLVGLGLGSDILNASLGLMPDPPLWAWVMIAILWACFADLLTTMAEDWKLPLWLTVGIGGVGGYLNYAGLHAFLGTSPSISLLWTGVLWAGLFPALLWIARGRLW